MRINYWMCLAALCAVSSTLQSQGTRGDQVGFVTRPYSFELSDGEPISWFLEFSEQLKLTPDQKTSLITIRRKLRLENGRFMERLDSVASAVGLTLGERMRMTPDERQAIERFNKITQPTRDSIKVNNDLARAEALSLLNTAQQARLDSVLSVLQRERGRGPIRRGDGGTDRSRDGS